MHFAFLFPRFKMLSGAERLILKLAAALTRQDHKISILCHQFDESCRLLLTPGMNLHVSGVTLDYFSNRYINAALDYFRSGRLLSALPESLDAVCCFGPALTAASGVRKRTGAPVFYFCYEPPRFLYTDRAVIQQRLGLLRPLAGPVFSMYRKRDLRMVQQVDGVLSNSEFGREQIRSIYARDAIVITHGLDPYRPGARRGSIRAGLGLREDQVAVITVNYLHPRKRLDLFLQALHRARETNPSLVGIIVGAGPERQSLEQLAGNAARFTGFIPDEQLFEYYQAADIYLHTGRLETFGLSVIEASGNGLPVVSVNEGGPLETVIEGQSGFLRRSEPAALADALLLLAFNPQQRQTLGEFGKAAVRTKYRWERGAEDFLGAVQTSGKHPVAGPMPATPQ